MKTIKHILSVTLVLVMLASCSSDDDSGSQPLQTLLSKRITSTETISYTYDNNNRAIGYSSENIVGENNYTVTYSYNSSGQLSETYYNTESGTYFKVVYSYNNDGQLTKIENYTVTDDFASFESKSEADYSTAGKVSVYRTHLSGTPYLNVEYYLDANGKITSQLFYSTEGFLIVTTENSYFDTKNAATLSLPKNAFVRNVNNYGTVTVTATGGTPTVGTYTYEYNSDDYPTKRTSNTGSVVTYE